jgi:hypothetical protein
MFIEITETIAGDFTICHVVGRLSDILTVNNWPLIKPCSIRFEIPLLALNKLSRNASAIITVDGL